MRFALDVFVLDDNSELAMPKDDVDTLFDNLQTLEPPQVLISRILGLSKNSLMLPLLSSTLRNPWQELDSLALCNDKRHLC